MLHNEKLNLSTLFLQFQSGFSYFKYFMSHNTSRTGDAYQPTFSCIGPLPQRLIAQEIPTTNSIQNVNAKSVVMVSPNPFSSKTTLKIVGSRNTFTAAAIKIYNVSGIDVTGQFSMAIIADNEMELTAMYALPGIYYIKADALHTTKLTLIPR